MTPIEVQQVLTEIYEAFPTLKRRLNESPRVLREWMTALRPLSESIVSEGISRWIRHYNTDPGLDQFLDLLDGLAEERRKRAASHRQPSADDAGAIIGDVLLHAADTGAQDDHDKAWGMLHVEIFMRGLATNTTDNRHKRALLYRQFAEEHPSLAGLALEAAEECEL